ncbi:MAG: rhodanese-like domain-containing protein [Cellulomonadaceae bacterium]
MSYAGDLTPQQAWELLEKNPDAVLVDVRTDGEWRTIGVPDTTGAGHTPRFIEWNTAQGPNPDFLTELRSADTNPDAPVLFLCRSGVRSVAAAQAATAAGYTQAYNILEGFEGAVDAQGARTIDGWRNDGLPTGIYGEADK